MSGQNHRTRLVEKRRADLIQLVSGLNLLPSTYGVPIRILQLHRSGTAAINDFADALAADPGLAAQLGEKARQRIQTHYDWDVICSRYEALFQKMLAAGKA